MYYKTYKKIHIAVDVLRLYCAGIRDEFKHDFAQTALNQILDALADEDIHAPEKSEDPEDTDDLAVFLPGDYDAASDGTAPAAAAKGGA